MPSPFFVIKFSLHFSFFWNLKNKKNLKGRSGGWRRKNNYLGREITFSIFHFLHSKSKTRQRQGTHLQIPFFSQNCLLCSFQKKALYYESELHVACCVFYEIVFFISKFILLTTLLETYKKCHSRLLHHVDRQNTADYDHSNLCKARQHTALSKKGPK